MRYIISDTHFGHDNIREYCDRPFDSVEQMDKEMLLNWNNEVSVDDTIIHLGDIRHHPDSLGAGGWLESLKGNILVVRGNHDGGIGQNCPAHTVTSATIKHGRYEFYLEHQPVEFSGWQIHGHLHNHEPFIDFENQRVNVSVEVIGYTPLRLDHLVATLDSVNDRNRIETYDD